MSKDDFKIVINSSNAIAGGETNNCNYMFDFSSVGIQGFYKLSFSFITTGSNLDLDNPLSAELKIDFNSSRNYLVSNTSISATSTTHIGFLYNVIVNATDGYLMATIHDNPVTIIQKPTNQIFNVQILKPDGTPFFDNLLFPISSYLLVLNFEKL